MNECWHHQAPFKREREGPKSLLSRQLWALLKLLPLLLIGSRDPQYMDTVTSEVARQSTMMQGVWGEKPVHHFSARRISEVDNH